MTYGPNSLFDLIIPITCSLLGAGFSLAWLYLRQNAYLGWAATAMFAFSLGICVQLYNVPASLPANSAVAATFFMTGAWAAARSIGARLGAPCNNALSALVYLGTTGLLVYYSSSLVQYRTERFYTMNFGAAAMLLLTCWRMLLHWPRQLIDRCLLVLFWLMALQFIVRTLLSVPFGTSMGDMAFVHSIHWQMINLTMFVFSLLFSLALMGATVVDLTTALREERNRDPLTSVLNRRGFDERFLRMQDERRGGTTAHDAGTALMLCDLDRFKAINDTHGHAAGDAVLRMFAEVLGRHVRASDLLGRYGGEEFVVLASRVDLAEARARAEAIRAEMAQTPLPGLPDDVRVTVSIGLVQLHVGESYEAALQRADVLLYRAKREGRNRVVATECGQSGSEPFPKASLSRLGR